MKHKMILPKKDVLVICFCVAFFTLCLAAMASRGRYHAQMTICQLNQKKMATGSLMFANDNDGELFQSDFTLGLWTLPLAEYTGKDEVRYCPSTKIASSGPSWGDSHTGWRWFTTGMTEAESGSYAFNGWFYSDNNNNASVFKNITEVQQPELTPLFADSLWIDSWPTKSDTCPVDWDLNGGFSNGMMMSRMLINRHFGVDNISFIDGHVEAIELKELWSLTWNKNWDIQHNRTRVDGSPIYR